MIMVISLITLILSMHLWPQEVNEKNQKLPCTIIFLMSANMYCVIRNLYRSHYLLVYQMNVDILVGIK